MPRLRIRWSGPSITEGPTIAETASSRPPCRSGTAFPLTFAIGDVHGERELLERAFAAIDARAGSTAHRIVMLGDYVDRGPDSAGVVAFLRAAQLRQDRRRRIICLKGNHEAMVVKAADSGETDHWFRNGGRETLASYGGRVDPGDLDWMRALPVHFSDGFRIYVHGGLEPHIALADQVDERCMWIREPFLRAAARALPAHVVHGHTPTWAGKPIAALPERLDHRTNLDTGAFWTGTLSVGLFRTAQPGGAYEVIAIRRRALPAPY